MARRGVRRWRERWGPALLLIPLAGLCITLVVLALRGTDAAPPNTSSNLEAPPSPTSTEPAEAALERPEGRPLKVVIAGDSLTFGLYASTEDKGWRPLTVAALSEDGPVKVSDAGEDGDKAATVLDSIDPALDTDLIVLEIGTNDLYKTPDERFSGQYAALVEKVTAAAPDAVLLCLGVWHNVDANRNFDPMIERPCTEAGGRFVPLFDLYDDPANRGPAGRPAFGGTSDDFHPNDAGHSAISARVLAVLGL